VADVGVVGVESEREGDGESPRAYIVRKEGTSLTEQVGLLHEILENIVVFLDMQVYIFDTVNLGVIDGSLNYFRKTINLES
jgi:hypothetical protein